MAEPKKIEIKRDIFTGKTIARKSAPAEVPPPPKAQYSDNTPPKGLHDTAKMDLPPLPSGLKPPVSTAQKKEKYEPMQAPPSGTPPEPDIWPTETPQDASQSALEKEAKRRISEVKGPVFISLERYREVKGLLDSLKENSHELRQIMEEFKDNKKDGSNLLTKSVDKLEHIEEDIENINATLRT